ncbi:MAG TPA: APC family permease [Longimicrobiales bacterium]|nr:APC family permease [Longimicrobiales bacterium]
MSGSTTELRRAEAAVEARSAELRKELGVRDLALTQILFIIGLTWIGVAGKLGPSHVVMWLLAVLLFFLPLAAVVIWLNDLMPLEGGIYQWAKLGFNEAIGFMVAWNLWLYVVLFASELGLTVATYLSYALGPRAAWMTTSAPFVSLASVFAIALLAGLAFFGLSLSKWVHNAGGLFMITIFGVLILLPFLGLATGQLHSFHPFRTEMPAPTLFNLNILGKLAVGAFAGFEYMAILAGETHSPASAVKKSVYIAAPVIALFFILGTATMVAYVPREQMDLIGPLPQVLRVGFGPFGVAGPLVTIAILMTLAMRVSQISVAFTAVTRLPMAAGWDRLLPGWFSRLHPRYRTPVNSIAIVALFSLGFSVISLVGVGQAEAFQLIFNASGIFYSLTYVVLFAIPLIGLRGVTPRPPWWVKGAAVAGLVMTLLYTMLSVFPIIDVVSVQTFALKITAVIVLLNAVGVGILVAGRRRSKLVAQPGT